MNKYRLALDVFQEWQQVAGCLSSTTKFIDWLSQQIKDSILTDAPVAINEYYCLHEPTGKAYAGVFWYKNGDHPRDDVWRPFEDTGVLPKVPREGRVVRYFRHPDISGTTICPACGEDMHQHGWVDSGGDGQTVCPGDWISTTDTGYIVVPRRQLGIDFILRVRRDVQQVIPERTDSSDLDLPRTSNETP